MWLDLFVFEGASLGANPFLCVRVVFVVVVSVTVSVVTGEVLDETSWVLTVGVVLVEVVLVGDGSLKLDWDILLFSEGLGVVSLDWSRFLDGSLLGDWSGLGDGSLLSDLSGLGYWSGLGDWSSGGLSSVLGDGSVLDDWSLLLNSSVFCDLSFLVFLDGLEFGGWSDLGDILRSVLGDFRLVEDSSALGLGDGSQLLNFLGGVSGSELGLLDISVLDDWDISGLSSVLGVSDGSVLGLELVLVPGAVLGLLLVLELGLALSSVSGFSFVGELGLRSLGELGAGLLLSLVSVSDLGGLVVDGSGDAPRGGLLLGLVGSVKDSLIGGLWHVLGVGVGGWLSPFERDSVGGGSKECGGEVLHDLLVF